jgi:hypothetical protein
MYWFLEYNTIGADKLTACPTRLSFNLLTLEFGLQILYNKVSTGMTGFDGRGWPRIASREAPTSRNQRKQLSANRTNTYAALPLAA